MASIPGGNTLGVAPDVTVVDTKAFNCGGSSSSANVVAALNWILDDATANPTKSAVVNLSFAFPTEASCHWVCLPGPMNRAVNTLVSNGIMVVAAAGNFQDNTANWDPASSPDAITVAGSARDSDTRVYFSNWGDNTDIYAPAQNMESAFASVHPWALYRSQASPCFDGSTWTDTGNCVSGTSFAAPLVAGVVARYLHAHHGASRSAVMSFLTSEGSTGNGVTIDGLPLLNLSDCP